jgi:cbb3-type cytochrome oxidase subunit 3
MKDLIKRINKLGMVILVAAALLSAAYEWKKLPFSILVGGMLGLFNLKGLAWGLRDFALYRASGKVIFLSIFRFFTLAFILIVLAVLKLINLIGILIGFTIVFVLVLVEGIRTVRKPQNQSASEEPEPSDIQENQTLH